MKTLRLFLWPDCPKQCPKCCNKNFDYNSLPVLKTFKGWDAICFTGGEPLLYPRRVFDIAVRAANENPAAKRYLYTALPGRKLESVIRCFHGVTVAVHGGADLAILRWFDVHHITIKEFSYVAKLFCNDPGILRDSYPRWQLKTAQWLDVCPLPNNETLMRLE